MTKELKEKILNFLPNANLQLEGLHENCEEKFAENVIVNYFKKLYPNKLVNKVYLHGVDGLFLDKYSRLSSSITFSKDEISHMTNYYEFVRGIMMAYSKWDNVNTQISIYYVEDKSDSLLELIELCLSNLMKQSKSQIKLLKATQQGLTTVSLELKKPSLNIETHYGKDFVQTYQTIISSVNEDKTNGKLILLHGEAGTGKSNLIKYMVSEFDKPVIFIPPNLVNCITNPDFTDFLINNNNSILILEDAEKVLTDRNISQDSSGGVSNLLNLTDGIYGDLLNIYVIATFNMDKEKIDSALLRKGRLIAEHKFDKLNVEQSNNLLKELELDYQTNVAMTLADIYNIEYEQPKVKTNNKKIGF